MARNECKFFSYKNCYIEFSISLVIEHEREKKLPIVIYRCPKTATTHGIYLSYEPEIDLKSEDQIETRKTSEIPIVISETENSTWDRKPQLNETNLIGKGVIR